MMKRATLATMVVLFTSCQCLQLDAGTGGSRNDAAGGGLDGGELPDATACPSRPDVGVCRELIVDGGYAAFPESEAGILLLEAVDIEIDDPNSRYSGVGAVARCMDGYVVHAQIAGESDAWLLTKTNGEWMLDAGNRESLDGFNITAPHLSADETNFDGEGYYFGDVVFLDGGVDWNWSSWGDCYTRLTNRFRFARSELPDDTSGRLIDAECAANICLLKWGFGGGSAEFSGRVSYADTSTQRVAFEDEFHNRRGPGPGLLREIDRREYFLSGQNLFEFDGDCLTNSREAVTATLTILPVDLDGGPRGEAITAPRVLAHAFCLPAGQLWHRNTTDGRYFVFDHCCKVATCDAFFFPDPTNSCGPIGYDDGGHALWDDSRLKSASFLLRPDGGLESINLPVVNNLHFNLHERKPRLTGPSGDRADFWLLSLGGGDFGWFMRRHDGSGRYRDVRWTDLTILYDGTEEFGDSGFHEGYTTGVQVIWDGSAWVLVAVVTDFQRPRDVLVFRRFRFADEE